MKINPMNYLTFKAKIKTNNKPINLPDNSIKSLTPNSTMLYGATGITVAGVGLAQTIIGESEPNQMADLSIGAGALSNASFVGSAAYNHHINKKTAAKDPSDTPIENSKSE